jgi:predicted NAD/FAD-binding protein
MKIAVIGSGISGLGIAHFLSKKHKVDLFEKDNHFGGHAFTVDVKESNLNEIISIDLGFIVFNKINYPNLLNFFHELNVPYEKSNMSFSVSVKNSNIEYSGNGLYGIFSNKLNIFNIKFLKMVKEILSFYNEAEKINKDKYKEQTLGDYLRLKKMSDYFINFIIFKIFTTNSF